MKKLRLEASGNTPKEAEKIMGMSQRVQLALDIIRAMFSGDSMELTLILRSRLQCNDGPCSHDGAHGAVFMEDETDIEKVITLLRRMDQTHKDIRSGKSAATGVTVLSEVTDGEKLN